MSMNGSPEQKITQELGHQLGERLSTAAVLFHAAVAERLGLNVTDWKRASILRRGAPCNPSRLAEVTGMSTAATTQVIDRLERAGIVRRERDPNVRRLRKGLAQPRPSARRKGAACSCDGRYRGKLPWEVLPLGLQWSVGPWGGWGRLSLGVLLVVIGVCAAAYANRPYFAGSRASDPPSAIRFSEPSVSRVIYYELTNRAPVQWFAIDNDKPRELQIQVGIPAGLAREEVDPVIVLFGPGLTDRPGEVKIDPPQGAGPGAVILSREGSPRRFYEPVTGTKSIILGETRVELPSPGTYYGAIYDARGREGKVWVGLGQREEFTWRDLPRFPGWIQKARAFHEVPGWPRWVWFTGAGLLAAVAVVGYWIVR